MAEKILQMLNWKNDDATKEKGRQLAAQLTDLSCLMQPINDKSTWEDCAMVLAEKSDLVLVPYLDELLEWLQDLNWPGTFIIIDRLKIFSADLLLEPFLQAVSKTANRAEDDNEWLDNLSILLENKAMTKQLNKQIYSRLKARYENFWGKKLEE